MCIKFKIVIHLFKNKIRCYLLDIKIKFALVNARHSAAPAIVTSLCIFVIG